MEEAMNMFKRGYMNPDYSARLPANMMASTYKRNNWNK